MIEPDIDAASLPISIDDAEIIVRAVIAPAHVKKNGKLSPAAFRPRAGASSVSAMRQKMGDDFCKVKALEIASKSSTGKYEGLLTIKANSIRASGSNVIDSREQWLGHADIDHGFASAPQNDPGKVGEFERMTERCRILRDNSNFHQDPDPSVSGWQGPKLRRD